MKELTIHDIETIIHRDESRILEVKKTTGELNAGMQSGCAFLNTEGGWLFFGIHPTTLKILGQEVAFCLPHHPFQEPVDATPIG